MACPITYGGHKYCNKYYLNEKIRYRVKRQLILPYIDIGTLRSKHAKQHATAARSGQIFDVREKQWHLKTWMFAMWHNTWINSLNLIKVKLHLFDLLCGFVVQQAVQQIHNKWKQWSLANDFLWICCSVAANHGRELTWRHTWRHIKIVIRDSSDCFTLTMANTVWQLSTSNLIDAYQNETCLWDTMKNSTEEEKELAWSRISVLFGTPVGNIVRRTAYLWARIFIFR